jgi:mannose-6-phosphate isomerase-like protein (cupin superfamily)
MRLTGRVDKGWGWEEIWATTDLYCGKFMHFRSGSCFSMHFHAHKDETWRIMSGRFIVRWIDTQTAQTHERSLMVGDVWHNPPLQPHQILCQEAGHILEVSTADSVEDNYRVFPGDSQA